MSDSGTWIEIALLAMLAGFIGLRLVSVLGRRTGHEKPAGEPYRPGQAEVSTPVKGIGDARTSVAVELPTGTAPAMRAELQVIADAWPNFDASRFVAGARAAYKIILEAFWSGDATAFEGLVSDEIAQHFRDAIAHRTDSGVTLANRLIGIDGASITSAQMIGQMAEITVRFDAQIAGVSTDRAGAIVGGSTSDATQTHDVWTFSHHVGSNDPTWLLIATDDDDEATVPSDAGSAGAA
jgi:predicted lipid-binding transport protein (Tim44 family)